MIVRGSWESTSVRVCEENGDNVIEIQIWRIEMVY
jgi:hypothetical protein